jgi:hypothetical protein
MCLDNDPEKRYVYLPHNDEWFLFDSFKPHWGSCPAADKFRRKK